MENEPHIQARLSFAAKPIAKPVIPKPVIREVSEYPLICKKEAIVKMTNKTFMILLITNSK